MRRLLIHILFYYTSLLWVDAQKLQDTLFIDIESAEKMFLQKNILLLAAEFNIDASKAHLIQAKAYPNPTFTADFNAYDPINDKYFNTGSNGQKAFMIEQLIVMGGKRKTGIEIAKKNIIIAELEFEELLRNLKLQLHTSFFIIHQYYLVIEKLDNQLSILDTLIQAYEIQARKGNLLLKDVIRLKTVYFKINNAKAEFSAIMLDEMRKMQLLLHNSDFIVANVAEDSFNTFTQIKPLQDLLDLALSNRPDFEKANEESASASLFYSLQKKMIIPDITINSSYDQHGGAIPNQINMGVSIPIPSWNLNRGNIISSKINVKTSQLLTENKLLEIETDVINAWRNHMRCCDEFRKLNQYYSDDFNVVFEGMNTNFQKGNVTILEFVDFIESYNESLNEMERIKTQLAISAARVNYYTASNVY